MEQGELTFRVTEADIREVVVKDIQKTIMASYAPYKESLKTQVHDFFRKRYDQHTTETKMEVALDWAIDLAYREAISKALVEVDFENKMKEIIKVTLADEALLSKLAEEKVRKSLGL